MLHTYTADDAMVAHTADRVKGSSMFRAMRCGQPHESSMPIAITTPV
jgi:hypothetical protein